MNSEIYVIRVKSSNDHLLTPGSYCTAFAEYNVVTIDHFDIGLSRATKFASRVNVDRVMSKLASIDAVFEVVTFREVTDVT